MESRRPTKKSNKKIRENRQKQLLAFLYQLSYETSASINGCLHTATKYETDHAIAVSLIIHNHDDNIIALLNDACRSCRTMRYYGSGCLCSVCDIHLSKCKKVH
jgi:hypothetical protein